MGTTIIESNKYHIGNENVANWPATIGSSWQKDFYLNEVPNDGVLTLDVNGTDAEHNEVFINNNRVGHLLQNSTGDYVACSLSVPKSYLRVGKNTILIKAGQRDHADIDDFLFTNVKIIL